MYYLTVDFGSTYTKLTAISSQEISVLGTASAFTTIDVDIMNGFNSALQKLEAKVGKREYDKILCCSSAGGGLKMVALGLVPELTAKAAKMAASSAGAKVVKTYSFEISKAEQQEIGEIMPDLVLLCGGTDGGNKEVILANAKRLCEIEGDFSIIAAGNKAASYELDDIFKSSDKDYVITENVMPTFNELNIEPARKNIKKLFIKKIIDAKGLTRAQEMATNEIIPTPLAVMIGCELFSKGTKQIPGLGEFVAVDLGGATTDIYSMATGKPTGANVLVKGLPEPFSKRTVEGDLGMRYSLDSLISQIEQEHLDDLEDVREEDVKRWGARCQADPSIIADPKSKEAQIEEAIARRAVEIAVERHCGYMESAYSPLGEIYTMRGKDLSEVPYVIGIGGAIINSPKPSNILKGAKFNTAKYNYMKPKNPTYMLDEEYIFSSMGLLSMVDAELAMKLLKIKIKQIEP